MDTRRKTYSVREAAEVIGISTPKTYDLCHAQGFPAIFIGRRIVIPVDRLHAWLDAEAEKGLAGRRTNIEVEE